MSPQVDISGWPNIDQVSAATGISRRTLERELAAGKWQTGKRQRPGVKPETVFDPDHSQFQAELRETRPPRQVQAFPLRMVL